MHVSPFQPVDGKYKFTFDIDADHVDLKISYASDSDDGLFARLTGEILASEKRVFLRWALGATLQIPIVLVLIHWQALKLKLRGAMFRKRPLPPQTEIS